MMSLGLCLILLLAAADPPPGILQPDGDSRHSATLPEDDFDQMLREAYELADDGDLAAALRALQRLVRRAAPETLAALDQRVRADRGQGLADWMAATRLRAALQARSGRLLELAFATPFEARALGQQLEALQTRLLGTEYAGRTIAAWSARPDAYVELCPDARHMVRDARLTTAVIGARLRLDPRLEADQEQRARLLELRAALAQLIARVTALPGFTALGGNADDEADPTLDEARRLAAEQAARAQPPAASRPARD